MALEEAAVDGNAASWASPCTPPLRGLVERGGAASPPLTPPSKRRRQRLNATKQRLWQKSRWGRFEESDELGSAPSISPPASVHEDGDLPENTSDVPAKAGLIEDEEETETVKIKTDVQDEAMEQMVPLSHVQGLLQRAAEQAAEKAAEKTASAMAAHLEAGERELRATKTELERARNNADKLAGYLNDYKKNLTEDVAKLQKALEGSQTANRILRERVQAASERERKLEEENAELEMELQRHLDEEDGYGDEF